MKREWNDRLLWESEDVEIHSSKKLELVRRKPTESGQEMNVSSLFYITKPVNKHKVVYSLLFEEF